jgi:hypothetical protein
MDKAIVSNSKSTTSAGVQMADFIGPWDVELFLGQGAKQLSRLSLSRRSTWVQNIWSFGNSARY